MALEIEGGDCLIKTQNFAKNIIDVLSSMSARHLLINYSCYNDVKVIASIIK